MVVVGADVHKRTHTFVAVDEVGRELDQVTVAATTTGHRKAIRWARERFGAEVRWGIEDCRHLSARLERDLLDAGQAVVRVPPKLMAQVRASARMLWLWRGLCCGSRICRLRPMMRTRGS